MIRIAKIVGASALVMSLVGTDAALAQPSGEIVIADELRTAFYEHAPQSLAKAMSTAVASWCSSGRGGLKEGAVSWLCGDQKRVYFRSVYVNGDKGSRGLVCEDNGTSSLRYFGMDLVAEVIGDGSCVPAEFDGSRYELHVNEFRDSDA